MRIGGGIGGGIGRETMGREWGFARGSGPKRYGELKPGKRSRIKEREREGENEIEIEIENKEKEIKRDGGDDHIDHVGEIVVPSSARAI